MLVLGLAPLESLREGEPPASIGTPLTGPGIKGCYFAVFHRGMGAIRIPVARERREVHLPPHAMSGTMGTEEFGSFGITLCLLTLVTASQGCHLML